MWEFRAGSTLFAVGTDQRKDLANPREFSFRRDASALWR
jgi:hypothetical protein